MSHPGQNWALTFALIPGTTNVPVSINTINGGCVNDYYGNYDSPINLLSAIEGVARVGLRGQVIAVTSPA